MFSRKILLLLGIAGLIAALCATPSAQGVVNEPVSFTFDKPVTVPGQTLPAGKYEFRVMNSQSDRQVIEIYSADGKKIGMFAAIAAARNDMPENAEIRFLETPANMPQAIATWWYPAKTRGHEFLYGKEQGAILAKLNKSGVAVADGDAGYTRMSNAEASAPPEPPPAAAAAVERPVTPTAPPTPPAPTPQARVATEPVPAPEPREALPHTASRLPIIAVVGLGALFAGLAMLARRRLV